jgi:hypothetical protein
MEGSTSKETHFQYADALPGTEAPSRVFLWLALLPSATRLIVFVWNSVTIISDAFESKMQPARHRMVYALLKEEMAKEGGIHALQLKTKTPAEEKREKEKGKA